MISDDSIPNGTLTLLGTGPGDPELLTLKAIKAIEAAQAIVAPKGTVNGASSALEIIKRVVDISDKEVVDVHFSMKKVHLSGEKDSSVTRSWDTAATEILKRTRRGMKVVFPTLGDPSLYSTAYYLLATCLEKAPGLETKVIPGISSMSTCSCTVQNPLALGDDLFCVIPATFDDRRIEAALLQFDSIALMKVHKCLPRLMELLEKTRLIDASILIERCGMEGQRIYFDPKDAVGEKLHYFSTLLVRKRGLKDIIKTDNHHEA